MSLIVLVSQTATQVSVVKPVNLAVFFTCTDTIPYISREHVSVKVKVVPIPRCFGRWLELLEPLDSSWKASEKGQELLKPCSKKWREGLWRTWRRYRYVYNERMSRWGIVNCLERILTQWMDNGVFGLQSFFLLSVTHSVTHLVNHSVTHSVTD